MKNSKDQIYFRQIIEYLLNHNVISTKDLSEDIGLSEKTVRNKLLDIEQYIKQNKLGEVVKKPRVGIWLEANENQRVTLKNQFVSQDEHHLILSNKQRINEIIRLILRLDDVGVTTQQLADDLYLSPPTIVKFMNDIEKWFDTYNLKLERVRNKGLVLHGSENSYRVALKNYIKYEREDEELESCLSYFFPGLDIDRVKNILISCENQWSVEFTDGSFSDLLIFVCISIYRNLTKTRKLTILDSELAFLQRHNEFFFAQAIFDRVKNEFNVLISHQELAFLSVQILCCKVIESESSLNNNNFVETYDIQLEEFVVKMLDIVGNILNFDFSEDRVLHEGLILHLRPTIFRLRYGRKTHNSLVNIIKNEYKQVYRALWAISVLFEEMYDLKVTEDELGYIALYIQAAIERKEHPLKITLVSHLSVGHTQLLIGKIRKAYPDIKHLESIPQHEFMLSSLKDTDIIISTEKLNIFDERIIEIDNFMSEQGLSKLTHRMMMITLKRRVKETKFDSRCHVLFEPDLIFLNVKVKNKEQLLKMLCDKLVEKGYVTHKYLKSVLDRENLTITSIGNKVSIPHGNQNEINEAKVVIATLDEPIQWNQEDVVDVVFLLAVKMNTPEEIDKAKLFYKQYISLVETDEKVDVLRKFKSNIEFYKSLIK